MKEIVSGIWTWSKFNEEKLLNFNGWYVSRGSESVLIDPPPLSESEFEFIRSKGKTTAIILTNKHHTRTCLEVQSRLDAPIWIHEKDQPLMDIEVQETYSDRQKLPGELVAITVSAGKTPGESALFSKGTPNALIIGDAIIGKPKGELSMLPKEKFKDVAAARAGLRPLLEVQFEALLLGDGDSILSDGRVKLENFISHSA